MLGVVIPEFSQYMAIFILQGLQEQFSLERLGSDSNIRAVGIIPV
jgi:hypothetical protein